MSLSLSLSLLEAQKPPKIPKYQKTPRLRELLRKVRANFCLLPCNTSQERDRNCSDKLVQMDFFNFGWIFSGGFSSSDLHLSNPACLLILKLVVPVASPWLMTTKEGSGPPSWRGAFAINNAWHKVFFNDQRVARSNMTQEKPSLGIRPVSNCLLS